MRSAPPWLALAVAALLVDLLLVLPNHPDAMRWPALAMVPLELPVLLLGMLALGQRASPLALLATVALTLATVLKLADLAAYTAFGRGFDPLADLHLVPAAAHLLRGSAGLAATLVVGGAALLVVVAAMALLYRALSLWARRGSRLPCGARALAGGVALVFAGLCAAEIRTALNGWQGWRPPGSAFTAWLAAENIRDFGRARAALAEFETAAAEDLWQGQEGLLVKLGGRDVVITFIESYGRAALDNPLYAARSRETLAAGEAALASAGLAVRSGWLIAPVQGGQSWLAHATLASGVEVSDQRRYRALLASARQSLFSLAATAGYRTMAVAPAIVMAWPEGPAMGFQEIRAAADLGYAGEPFNWVTMPDQYTLAAFDRELPSDQPLLAEIALISSHAPWTPVPEMVPWVAVGDGSVFDAEAIAGPTPREVWADRDRIRDHYGRSLDYALRTVLSWAALPRRKSPLILVLGDHQPVEFVAQAGGKDVPAHLIGPPEALALFDGWGWREGLQPDPEQPAWPMRAFRDRFLRATSALPGDLRADGS
ncbi:sulfatase-like hydrolase/transferase [Alloyangia pacifica]|uniref:sulfatase-like hydrolase/transferase n=1 Tax=Alloyangia pacifica TaxID=311180 RepID=UPI001CFC5C73|nr:sulfatase-like hydrolase/transferase [Alloyangia pacifica]